MARTESVAVVGVGHTRYGKLPEYDAYELGLWALKEALASMYGNGSRSRAG